MFDNGEIPNKDTQVCGNSMWMYTYDLEKVKCDLV